MSVATIECAAALGRLRILRFGLGLTVLATITGCISIPLPPDMREHVRAEGAMGTRIGALGPVVYVETLTYVPGAEHDAEAAERAYTCASSGFSVEVTWASATISQGDAIHACQWALAAVDYVAQFVPSVRGRVEYRLVLVPDGVAGLRRSFSIGFLGALNPLNPLYLKHWFRAEERSRRDIVDTLAHESMHLFDGLWMGNNRHDEEAAYLAGFCAQLNVLGVISRTELRTAGAVFPQDSLVPASARQSGEAGIEVAKQIGSYFTGSVLSVETPAGKRLNRRCRKKLTEFFTR